MENEIWKDVAGFEEYYKVSNKGIVKSKSREYYSEKANQYKSYIGKTVVNERVMKPVCNGNGYLRFNFIINGVQNTVYLHRIMATAFIPNPENKPCVNHINGIKVDNSIGNLEWCTYKENRNHAIGTGLVKTGVDAPLSKLTRKEVLEIKALLKTPIIQRRISEKYGVCPQTITNIKQGVCYSDVYD